MTHLVPVLALAAGGDSGASILTPDGSLLLVLLMFVAFVPVLNRILFQPITRVLAERDRLTKGSSRDAENILNSIDHKLSEYEESIRSARAEGYKIIEARRNTSSAERQTKIDAARADAEGRIAAARQRIAADAEAAKATLLSDAGQIAVKLSSTLLGRAVKGGL